MNEKQNGSDGMEAGSAPCLLILMEALEGLFDVHWEALALISWFRSDEKADHLRCGHQWEEVPHVLTPTAHSGTQLGITPAGLDRILLDRFPTHPLLLSWAGLRTRSSQ